MLLMACVGHRCRLLPIISCGLTSYMLEKGRCAMVAILRVSGECCAVVHNATPQKIRDTYRMLKAVYPGQRVTTAKCK
jgi:hypothetical protein